MASKFIPRIDKASLTAAISEKDYDQLYDMLAQPLHEELYRQGSFGFMNDLSPGQQLLIAYDYVRTQVGQGGFIQFIQNGYIALLPDIIAQLIRIGANDMANVFDDVLKVYVLNREILEKETTVEEFARLYDELREFEGIEERYNQLTQPTIKLMMAHVLAHPAEYFTAVEP